MPKANITAKFVAQVALPKSGRIYYADAKLPGFSLCVSATGSKVFYWIGRDFKGPTRIKLERYPKVTAEKARDMCVQVHADVIEGKPPRTRTAKNAATVGKVWAWHLENNLKPNNRTWEKDERTYNLTVRPWADLPISAITRTMIIEKKTAIFKGQDTGKGGPGAANKFLSVIRGIFRTAVAEAWVVGNPAAQIKKFPIAKRRRFITEDEMLEFFTRLRSLKQTPQDYFEICLLTAARRSNVCAMAWSDINFNLSTWTIPAESSKSKEAIVLPLSTRVMEILGRRRATAKSPFVFPGRGRTGYYIDPKKQWIKLLSGSSLSDLRIHDLRRTLGSWQANAGVPIQTIGASLGHGTDLSATLIYARMNVKNVRESIQVVGDSIILAATAKKIENSEK